MKRTRKKWKKKERKPQSSPENPLLHSQVGTLFLILHIPSFLHLRSQGFSGYIFESYQIVYIFRVYNKQYHNIGHKMNLHSDKSGHPFLYHKFHHFCKDSQCNSSPLYLFLYLFFEKKKM